MPVHADQGEADDGGAARHAGVEPRDQDRVRLRELPRQVSRPCSPRAFPGRSPENALAALGAGARGAGRSHRPDRNRTRPGSASPTRPRRSATRWPRRRLASYEPAPLGASPARARPSPPNTRAAGSTSNPDRDRDHRQLERIVRLSVQAAAPTRATPCWSPSRATRCSSTWPARGCRPGRLPAGLRRRLAPRLRQHRRGARRGARARRAAAGDRGRQPEQPDRLVS